MDLPGLNPRPGRVVEVEIRRKFGTLITPASSNSRSFFLVVSLLDVVTGYMFFLSVQFSKQ
jgi:hypothetical protein